MRALVDIKDIKVGNVISYYYKGRYQVKTAHALVLNKQYDEEHDEWVITCQSEGGELGYSGQIMEIYYEKYGDIAIQEAIGYDDDRYDYFKRLACNELTQEEIDAL